MNSNAWAGSIIRGWTDYIRNNPLCVGIGLYELHIDDTLDYMEIIENSIRK